MTKNYLFGSFASIIEILFFVLYFYFKIEIIILFLIPFPVLCINLYLFYKLNEVIDANIKIYTETKLFLSSFIVFLFADTMFSLENIVRKDMSQFIIMVGVSLFLLGHFINIIAFSIDAKMNIFYLVPFFAIYSAIVVIIRLCGITNPFVGIGFLFYFLFLTIVAWRCFDRIFKKCEYVDVNFNYKTLYLKTFYTLIPTFGYLLFITSDIINSFTRFKIINIESEFIREPLILVPYFIGQTFISTSINYLQDFP